MTTQRRRHHPINDPERLVDLKRSERSMMIARWVAAPWALIQILAYDSLPYPAGVRSFGLLLVGCLVVGNLAVWYWNARTRTTVQARGLALASIALDIAVVSGIVWTYAFDPGSALWAVLFILPLEGAIRFQLQGAIATWAAVAAIYCSREIWGSDRYGYELEWNSITFRMGIGLLIALVAGLMARDLVRERQRVAAALSELQRIDALRQGLVSTLAHDVRNPLTVIRGVTSTVLAKGQDMPWETLQHLMSGLDRQGERLQRLAMDLLDLARLEQGKLELALEPVQLRDVVEKALRFADEHEVFEDRVDKDHRVMATPDRLEQIIVNLVANALRYGHPPFEVTSSRSGDQIAMIIRDHGPGVPEDQQVDLFEPFRTETDTTSVGFGLAVVKALAEAQGGSVSYSDAEPGACFRVTLPAADGMEERDGPTSDARVDQPAVTK